MTYGYQQAGQPKPVAQPRNSQYASQLQSYYKTYLGRDASQSEIQSRLNDPASPGRAWFARGRPGLYCGVCRRTLGLLNTWELTAESRTIAELMLRTPIAEIPKEGWQKERTADLRRFLVQRIEDHIERKLITSPVLEAA